MKQKIFEADLLAALKPNIWKRSSQLAQEVEAEWNKRGERTFFLRRPRTVAFGQLWVTLEMLEDLDIVESREVLMDPKSLAGGHPRIEYKLTQGGVHIKAQRLAHAHQYEERGFRPRPA